ncbi:hypothetical protein GEMRC1_004074 [Eukaryota sp. GEM-RC1]
MRYTVSGIGCVLLRSPFFVISSGCSLSVFDCSCTTKLFHHSSTSLIRFCGISSDYHFFYVIADDIQAFSTKDWSLHFHVPANSLTRRISCHSSIIHNDTFYVIFADREGDVYITRDSRPVHLLGHLLGIHSLIIDSQQQYIFTTDRDDRIRKTLLPSSDIIDGFFFGNSNTISSLATIQLLDSEYLISIDLDGNILLFDVNSSGTVYPLSSKQIENFRYFSILCVHGSLLLLAGATSEDSIFKLFVLNVANDKTIKTEAILNLSEGEIPSSSSYCSNRNSFVVGICHKSSANDSEFLKFVSCENFKFQEIDLTSWVLENLKIENTFVHDLEVMPLMFENVDRDGE